jgi:hypothetical protein
LLQRYEKVLGKEHPDALTSIGNIVIALQFQEKYKEAKAISRNALKGREKTLKIDYLDTLISVYHLAVLLLLKKQHNASSELY